VALINFLKNRLWYHVIGNGLNVLLSKCHTTLQLQSLKTAHAEFLAVILLCSFSPLPSAETATIAPIPSRSLCLSSLCIEGTLTIAGERGGRRQKTIQAFFPLLFHHVTFKGVFKSTGLLRLGVHLW
jgi:hypothetical protein